MAVGDAVTSVRNTNDPSVPLIGIVNDEPGGDLAQVVWRNGNVSVGVPFASLLKVFPGDDFALSHVGKWVQIDAFNEHEDQGGFPPKSPAAAGVVLDAFGTGDYDAVAAASFWLSVSTEDGRGMILVPSVVNQPAENVVTIQDGRRRV